MNEYKIVYMSQPISEIPKIVYIDAVDKTSAIKSLDMRVPVYDLISIELT
jgi:hypothetical protein